MAKREIETCDRCGKRIERKGLISKVRHVKRVAIFGFGPYDYSDSSYDLCKSCSQSFVRFMMREEEHGQPK